MRQNILTIDEAAELLKVSKQTLRLWNRKGVLRFRKIESRAYYLESDIIEKLEKTACH